ncbi:MAG: hypothetical protein AB2693_18240 [Candidatus Thiodiazotropha sp.]
MGAADAPTRQAIPYQTSLLVSVIRDFPTPSANIVESLGVMAIKTTQLSLSPLTISSGN